MDRKPYHLLTSNYILIAIDCYAHWTTVICSKNPQQWLAASHAWDSFQEKTYPKNHQRISTGKLVIPEPHKKWLKLAAFSLNIASTESLGSKDRCKRKETT